MALTQRLEFRQSQSLVMTPQLMQAIKLLQLSNLDLSTFVEDELERNPLLERASDGSEPAIAGEAGPERAEFTDHARDDSFSGQKAQAILQIFPTAASATASMLPRPTSG